MLAGGVALNCVATENSNEQIFENLGCNLQQAMQGAIGAALAMACRVK